MAALYESLGAVYGWVYNESLSWETVFVTKPEICHVWYEPRFQREYFWCLLYWPAIEFCGEPPQLSAVRAGGIWSGYMSEARGLSWDRKSRYGKK